MRKEAAMKTERYHTSKSGLIFALPLLILIIYLLLTI